MPRFKLLSAVLPLVVLVGCSANPTNVPAPQQAASAQASQADVQTVVANTMENGTKSVAITVTPPRVSGYHTAAVVHHWVANDVYQYEATLKVWNSGSSTWDDLATPVTVVIPQKNGTPKTKAVFTNLKQGAKYEVVLVAKGNDGGSAADTILNADDTGNTSVFDFTATQDVEDTASATMTITFDQVAFSGTGTATVSTPEDGTFANPTDAATGTAQ
ncbi:MAG TPA: hypothetical protein V6D47_12905 [Oscillatoriaceae cyanobacterium]